MKKKVDLNWVKDLISDRHMSEAVEREVGTIMSAAADNIRPPLHLVVYSTKDIEGSELSMAFIQAVIGDGVNRLDAYKHMGLSVADSVGGLPVLAILVAESWGLFKEIDPSEDDEEQKEKVRAEIKGYGSIENHPDKMELILVSCPTLDGRKAAATMPFETIDGELMHWILDDFDSTFTRPDAENKASLEDRPLDAFFNGVMASATFKRITA